MQAFTKSVLIICLMLTATAGFAGFPIGKNRWLLAPSYNLYNAKGYWDKGREFSSYSNSGKFTSHYFGFYGGTGISDKADLVFNLPFVISSYQETGLTQTNSSLGDASVGISYLLNDFDYYKFLSITGSLIIPLYNNSAGKLPTIGYAKPGAEVKLGFSGTNRTRLKNTYWDVSAGIRQFFDSVGPTQVFFDALFGIPLDESWKFTVTLSSQNSTSRNRDFDPNNPFINRYFSTFRITPAIARKINETTSINFSVFADLSGKNIGRGTGAAITGVIKFGTR
jgi:hypothetical protein